MAKFIHDDVKEKGPDHIRTLAESSIVRQHILKTFTEGQSYAQVVANSCAVVTLAAADLTWSGAGIRTLTIAAKSAVPITTDVAAGSDLHVAIVDQTAGKVLVVTDETTNQALITGGTKDIPEWTINSVLVS